jgi:hypothetical protein
MLELEQGHVKVARAEGLEMEDPRMSLLDVADTYQQLADWHHRHGHPQQRDRFLLLAAYSALADGQPDTAESFRQKLLRHNPHHLLKPYHSFEEAMQAPDVDEYARDLLRSYPPETAADLLSRLPYQKNTSSTAQPAIPPTQPLIDLDAPSSQAAPTEEELPRVYRVRQDPAESPAKSRPRTAVRSQPANFPEAVDATLAPQRPPQNMSLPTQRPTPAPPVRPLPVYDQKQEPPLDDRELPDTEMPGSLGSLVCTGLAVLFGALSLGLVLYTLFGRWITTR